MPLFPPGYFFGTGTSPPPPPPPPAGPPVWGPQLDGMPLDAGPLDGMPAVLTPIAAYDLFEAAVIRLRSAASALIPGGFHSNLAPASSVALGTYAEVKDIGGPTVYVSGGTSMTDGILQISTFAASRALAKRAGDSVRSALKDAHLLFQTGHIFTLRPLPPRMLEPDPRMAVGGANLFQDISQLAYTFTTP